MTPAPAKPWLLEGVTVPLAYQHTCLGVAASGVVSVWPQAVAEALVLNHIIKVEAGIERAVPAFGGDLGSRV